MIQKHAGVHKLLTVVLLVSGILLAAYFLFWHVRLGLIRYFDIDEFAHLHWASEYLMGKRPYIDIFLFIPPGFQWFLSLAFIFGWGTYLPIITGRVLMAIVFTVLCFVVSALFWEERKSKIALIVSLVLAFLPLPFDKFLEIRPDNLGILFLLFGMVYTVKSLHTYRISYGYVSGACYAMSIVVLTKFIPSVLFAFAFLFTAYWYDKKLLNVLRAICISFFIPLLLVFFWAVSLGDLARVLYSLTALAFEVNVISRTFIMMPDLFFYPNAIFYGQEGYTLGLYVNHAIWIIGLAMGLYRLLTPFFIQKKQNVRDEFFIAGMFFVHIVLYVQFIPLKHAQYLIPTAVFIAWYTADAVYELWRIAKIHIVHRILFSICALATGFGLYVVFGQVNKPKLAWTNSRDMQTVQAIFSYIPKGAHVLDLVGTTLYYPSPYPVCCLPFGQFAQYLSRQLPPLAQTLERTKTPYIYEGAVRRIQTLSYDDQIYIQNHYTVSAIDYLWVRK